MLQSRTNLFVANTGTPTITAPDTDPATVGTTLTATAGDIADLDGLPSTFTYQWSRVDADGTSNEEAIAGATASTYVLAADDVGKKVTVALTFTDTLGSEETRTSAVYPETGTIVAAAAACAAPSFGTRRNIWTGNMTVGMTSPESYGFDSGGGNLDDKTFTIGSNNYEIDRIGIFTAGLTAGNINFSLKDSDLTSAEKAALRLHVCNADYNFSAGVLSGNLHTYLLLADLDWSGVSSRTLYLSLPPNNAATGAPTISGTTTVDSTLTAAKGTIVDADGVPVDANGVPTTFTYQWVRVDGATEMDISAATSKTYTLVAADVGKKLKVKVGFTDNLSGEEARTSAATGTVTTVPTPVALVSNIGQSDDRNYNVGTGFVGQDLAQGFTTGTSGATLTRIEIRMDTSSGTQSSVPTATLHRGSPTSAAVATLTGPSEIANAAANYAFTAPANTTLAASTTYYVVLEGGVVDIRARVTNSDNEDSGGKTGWSVADGGGFRRDSSTAAFTDISQALLIRVNGTVTTAPGAPQDFKVSAGDAQVVLTWAAPASDGGGAITEYEYRYSTGATVSASATWTDVPDGSDDSDSTADETGVTVSGLTNGTQYAFEVRAVNSAGDGAAAGPVTATPVTVPGAPQDFKVSAGDTQVVLTWGAPASDDGAAITEFEYRYSAGAAVAPNAIWTDVADGSDAGNSTADETSVTISSLTNGTEYAFEVRAVNSAGGGAAAGPVTATPVAPTAPGAPAVFTATAGNGKVDLSWAAPVSDDGAAITKYRYRYSTGATVSANATWADVPDGSDSGSSAADERSVTVSSLTNTTQYAFEVLAVNSVGEGAAAGPATATPTTTPITRTTTMRLGDFDGRTQVLPTLPLTGGYTLVIIFNGITETTGFGTNDVSVSRGRVVSARRSTTTRNSYVVKILVEDAVGGNEVVIGVRPNAIDQGSLPVSLTRTTDAPMTTTMTTSATEPVSRDFTVVTIFSQAAVALTSESSTGVIDPAGTETGTRQVTTTNCSLVSHRVFDTTRVTLRIRPRAAFQGTCRVVYIGGILQHSTQSYTSNSEGVLDVRVDTRTPPGAPTSFMATVDDGEVTLSWAAPASDGGDAITEYEYRYSEGDTVLARATWTDVTDGGDDGDSTADETGVTISSLTNGTEYAFEVRAVNSLGDGTKAGPVTATPAVPTAPGAPQNLTATAGDSEVTLSWAAPASDDGAAITEYEYRYSAGATVAPNATWTGVADGSDDGDSTADETGVTISSLTNATQYAFEVRAVNRVGDGTAAGPVTATPVAPTAPGAPASFMATAGDTKVTLSWAAPASDDGAVITEYEYRYSQGAMVSSSEAWTDVADGSDSGSSTADETGVTISSLINGTRYAFEVRAVNRVGGGTKAGPVTATPFTVSALVSNIGQSNDASSVLANDNDISQGFTTGASPAILTSVEIRVRSTEIRRQHPRVTLRRGSPTSAVVASLRAPGGTIGITTTNFTYTARANTMLAASTTYYVVLDNGEIAVSFPLTNSDSEDNGGQTGWSMADGHGRRLSLTEDAYTDYTSALMIRVNGALTVTAPGAPQNFEATAGDEEVTLSWGAPASDGGGAITEYEYRYSAGSTVSADTTWTDVTDGSDAGDSTADETGVTISGLTNDTEYAFEVRAVNSAGEGTAASAKTATPMAVSTTGALVSNIGQTDSFVTKPISTSSASGYELAQGFTTGATGATLTNIEIRMRGGSNQPLPAVTLHEGTPESAAITALQGAAMSVTAGTRTYTWTATNQITPLAASTTYFLVLKGTGASDIGGRATGTSNEDSGGQTGWSIADAYEERSYNATTDFAPPSSGGTPLGHALLIRVNGTVNTAPGAPQNFEATVGDEEVTLSWGAPASDGGAAITEYEYRYSAGSAVAADTTWTDVTDGSDGGDSTADETGVTISSLTNGTEYAFEVRAVNSVGDGTAAGPVTATPASSCAAPNFGTRRGVWTGTVTVGTFTFGGDTLGYGFFGTVAGSLDDKTFSIGANSYEIDDVGVSSAGTIVGDMQFGLKDSALTTAERAALKLHVCDAAFDFSAATHDSSTYTYTFAADLDWSGLSTRTVYLSLPANNAATGAPEILGTATVGETLTAAKGTIADADGVPTTFTYQWVRVDGLTETDITGATSSTYTLASADSGKKLKVKVGFTDNLSGEEERKSDASGTVTAVPTTGALVSNIGQSVHTSSATLGSSQDLHQAFTTGTGGATLTSIEIKLGATVDNQAHPVVTLHSGSATSAAVATLTAPGGNVTAATANYTYTAPANTMLTASTTYYVVLEGGGTVFVRTTGFNEDSGGQTGWSIANGSGYRTGSSTGAFTISSSSALMIRVNGTVTTVPGAPTSFTATAGDEEVTLSWAAPASDGGAAITEYEYRYSEGATVSASATWTDVTDGSDDGDSTADETGVTILSLTNGTEYAFEVRAVNSVGDGTAAGSVTATPTANSVPTSADKTVTTAEDTAYTFGASDFAFTDTDTGDALVSVTVVTLPTVGTLALDGTDVTAADVVSKADIDDSKLVFTPAPNENGTPYTTFTFRVSDGTAESASAYTLTVTVTAVNDAATGQPSITGTATVGRTLMAATSGIADVDGKTKAVGGDAGFAWSYQWVRVDGVDETDISGATSDSYTLVDADNGKQVKVKVRFTDDGGTAEGPLTSAAYPSGDTVGTNTAPASASADKTVTTNEDTAYTFQASDFAFTDTDTGDALVSVTVVTLPTVGTLALDGTDATTDQAVAAAALGDLVFTPAPNGNGTGYASFTFKVSDGVSESVAYTLTVTVTAVNDAATGQPSIEGTALVGQTLTASTSDIADIDGKTKAEDGDTGFAYTYQWVRVDSGTEADISGETSDSYVLAAADNGKQVKVKVRFTDDGDTDEGPLTSAAYPSTDSVMTQTVTVAAGGEVDEGDDAEFTLTLSAAPPTGGQSVSYSLALTNPNPVADRAHVAAADLGAKTATVAAGETTATVTVATVDVADLVSKNSTLTLSLTAAAGYTLGSTAAAEVTIDDTTTATVTYSGGACSATVSEGAGSVDLGVQLDKDVAFQISILFIDIPATAGAGNDYVAPAPADRSLVFPALTRTKNFTVGIVDNEQLENDEVFDIELFRNGLDAAITINTGCTGNFLTVTIEDDDTAELSISAPTPVTEGSNIRVTVAPPTGACVIPFQVTVTLTPSGDTNGLGSADAKSLRLSPCSSGTANFATADDSVKTAERSLLFTLSLPANADSRITLPATPSASVTVTDDEALKVTGVAVTSTPSSGSTYGAGETLSFTATFNGPVTVTGTPQLPFSLGGVTKQAAYASGSDSTELALSYTVAAGDNDTDGISWAADSLSLNGGTIKFMTGIVANQVGAALTHAAKTAQSGHKVDTPPVLSTRTVNGAALVLTYNEALDTGSEPAGSAFTVKVGGTAVSLATSGAVAVAGKTVTLTLAAAVAAADTVTVSYAVPGSNPLQDAGGMDAPAFTDLAVTNGTGNTAPAFANDTAARSFTETVGDAVAAAGNVGAVVTATDVDADTLTYSLEGADAAKFGIVSTSGQLQTRAGEKYDREAKASYSVTVKADDSNGGTDTVAVTITLADAVEIPLAPGMPAVSATSGSTTSLDVSWTAPVNTGRPALSGYKLQYRTGGGAWTDHAHSGTGTSATIAGLTAATVYEVQVRALNADGDGAWSASGSGTTGSPSNNAPAFANDTAARSFTETVGDAVAAAGNVGAVVTATDADADTLTYSLEGTDAAKFTVNSSSGQLRTRAGERYDREAKASYAVRVKADDGNSGTDTVAVTITLTNAVEIPPAPVAPTVSATSGSTTSLDVSWTAPANTGRPAITGYKLRYRTGSGAWTDHAHSGTGTTGSASNNAPEFSGTATSRSFTETVGDATEAAARDVGAVVTATDADNDTLTYSLEGTDAAKFTVNSSSGQLRTRAGERYDREAKASYAVRVKADDGNSGTDTVAVTITLTNAVEIPPAPVAPTVSATSGSTTSLDVSWTAPAGERRRRAHHNIPLPPWDAHDVAVGCGLDRGAGQRR